MTAAARLPAAPPAGPPVRRFGDPQSALEAITAYTRSLGTQAAARRLRGLAVADQDHAELGFCLVPARSVRRPLVLVGGMGPLAGALAFRRACERFGESRAITLYQACDVPDRTPAILADVAGAPGVASAMAVRLADAVARAVALLPEDAGPADCMMVCNSAHYFWSPLERALAGMPALARRVNLVSLVGSAKRALAQAAPRRSLLLCTQGARRGRLFADAAVRLEAPPPDLDAVLMDAIYAGIKALDDTRAVVLGTRFFEAVLRDRGGFDGIVAGCTEIPPLIALLRRRGPPAVSAFLAGVTVIDPLEAALDESAAT